ncbi:MAG: hypothetical protein ACRD2L_08980, partial [Terriglobia bacterium]
MSQGQDLKKYARCSTLEPRWFRKMVRVNNINTSIRPFQLGWFLLLYFWLAPFPPHLGTAFQLIPLAEAQSSDTNSQATLVTQEFRYHSPEAGEVWLVWGINGWQQASDTFRPPGTIVKDKVLHTPLVRTGSTFITT